MPCGTAFVLMSSMSTCEPWVDGRNPWGVKVGSLMWPVAGGVTEGSGRMSYSGWPVAAASKSPTSPNVTLLLKAALLDTSNDGPSTGDDVVAGRAISTGGWIEKSGIDITVPL